MTKKIPISPKISPASADTLADLLGNRNAGLAYVAEVWPRLYRRTLAGLKGRFDERELKLMIDVSNGTALTPQLAGDTLSADIADGIALDGLAEKWQIEDAPGFQARVAALAPAEAICLELWAWSYWYGRREPDRSLPDLDAYIAALGRANA